jgi:hypothetical protein
MLDFMTISTRPTRSGQIEIYPKFRTYPKSQDLMIRGGDFYAVWVEELGLWSTDEDDLKRMIDKELDNYAKEHKEFVGMHPKISYMWDSESGSIDKWHKFCQKQMRDSYTMLDDNLLFANSGTNKKDYASKRLNYPLEPGDITAYDKLISTLYSEEERHKLEWAIGAIVTGESKHIQKFLVLYGAAGTGKSTILNIIQQLFDGYYCVFDAKALGSSGSQFALEPFRNNPLVAIQHDGDLSKIEDNTRLNSLVSHEKMIVNEKYTKGYTNDFKCFLFMGTNTPVRITDSKSGLLRRLIDVEPTGNKVSAKEYRTLMKQITFELGAIAYHCKEVYLEDPHYYDDYTPISMMSASNDFFNFMLNAYHVFYTENGTTLKAAWEMYKVYCEDAKIQPQWQLNQRKFKEELKEYFDGFDDRFNLEDGSRVRSYYHGFRVWKFDPEHEKKKKEEKTDERAHLIKFTETTSNFDIECAECPAQYASSNETPIRKWDSVNSTLSELDTSILHYVKVPENHIVIDFDIKDADGNKSFEKNVEAASKWPATYAELSKSGSGVHLHYIYTGDPTKLSRVYDDDIEIKVFTGKSSLRRKLTKCNGLHIATISSGLPLKGEKMINTDVVQTEKGLRTTIKKNLRKEVHPGTKPSIDFIYKILEEAYDSGLKYDVSDLKPSVIAFAAGSSNHADYCIKIVNKMPFKSEDASEPVNNENEIMVFYDVEVFPNLFLVNYKAAGEGKPVVRLINPSPSQIEDLLKYRLIGFNCRRYDNHIMYARLMGYTNEQLYNLSQRIISGDKNAFFGEAYNLSYTDVYDFSVKKQSLKKWEIELGIHHQELGLPWDQPVPEERWVEVAEYCDNDVIATEAVFNHCAGDFTARKILAKLANATVNDTTNSLTTKIIFGNDRNPQTQFNYRNMGETSDTDKFAEGANFDIYTRFDKLNRPVFPGYKFERGKSSYRNVEEIGEGGRVYAQPNIWGLVALLDIASMHPASIIAEQLFGVYTQRFQDIRDARVAIKHKDFDAARKMLDGALAEFLDDESIAADLAQALKIAINSVYGLTSAGFPNPFKDPRNVDNIVAKRGALFMINLQHEVEKRGFKVAHIKTDSIKIPDANPEIIKFVMDYGEMYGYSFEHEATYDRMCLVNDAVYIAKYATAETCMDIYGYVPGDNAKHGGEWTATGTQFQVPYVFKKLFSKEEILFEDMCETKSVKSSLYLDINEGLPDVSNWELLKSLRESSSDTWRKKDFAFVDEYKDISDEELERLIEEGHSYRFIGKVGNFCPVKPGRGGGELLRDQNGKFYSATGAKGYRWLEAEMVKCLDMDIIDRSYYDELVNDAIDTISQYGDFEWFVSDEPYIGPDYIPGEEMSYPNYIEDKVELPFL